MNLELKEGRILVDGNLCWYVQREHPIHESPFYYVEEHNSASLVLPADVRRVVNEAAQSNDETKRTATSSLKRAFKVLQAKIADIELAIERDSTLEPF